MKKMCRICWNTQFWRRPTGEAAPLETNSFVHTHKFGHEEWLFNFAWLQPGPRGTRGKFRYGFLQPIGKYWDFYKEKTLSVLLYTIDATGRRIAVATIDDLYVPALDELDSARRTMKTNGWLKEMKEDLKVLNISPQLLSGPSTHMMNVRFSPSKVTVLEGAPVFPPTHPVTKNRRYHHFDSRPFVWMQVADAFVRIVLLIQV